MIVVAFVLTAALLGRRSAVPASEVAIATPEAGEALEAA